MRIVLAPDSFKESMTAAEAAAAMARGVRQVLPTAECVEVPMADGGEGTTAALTDALGGRLVSVQVPDALGRPITARFGLMPDGLAVIEVAAAVGLADIEPELRDPMTGSSLGVAALVLAALDRGARRIIVGLGGSATNDGGAGLLAGLGARLLGHDGEPVSARPDELDRVVAVDLARLDPRLGEVSIDLACDVTNPLLGPNGASAVFGPQKGATTGQVARLDEALTRWADALERGCGRVVRDLPGAGAAGGLGAAFLALGARRRAGVEVVIEAVGLEAAVAGAELVLTGEGSIDAQTLAGKTPAGVAEVAARHGVPVIAFAGRVAPDANVLVSSGAFLAVVPILREVTDLPGALRHGEANLTAAVATALRLYLATPATA